MSRFVLLNRFVFLDLSSYADFHSRCSTWIDYHLDFSHPCCRHRLQTLAATSVFITGGDLFLDGENIVFDHSLLRLSSCDEDQQYLKNPAAL